jgi:hypothetical protein
MRPAASLTKLRLLAALVLSVLTWVEPSYVTRSAAWSANVLPLASDQAVAAPGRYWLSAKCYCVVES